MTSDERAVLSANSAFYAAFRAHDLVAMDILWSHDANVQCVHPGWSPIEGREQVLQTFQSIFSHGAPDVREREARVTVLGEVAFVVCLETLTDTVGDQNGAMAATNVFRLEAGRWRMVHHHAGPIAQRDEVGDDDEPPPLLN